MMKVQDIKQMYDDIVEIIGDGGLYKTQILINEHNIQIKTDLGVNAKRVQKLDEYFGEEAYISATNGMIYLQYHLPSIE